MTQVAVTRCLSIAASDSGGGAGVQADLKAFAAAGCHGSSVITAITAQNTRGVQHVHVLPAAVVRAQLESVLSDIGSDGIKTGALLEAAIIDVVADGLAGLRIPIVVDPVLSVSADRTPLLDAGALAALVRRLMPVATVLTPNLAEAERIAGVRATRRELAERLVAMGARAVIITGGHGAPVDHLFDGTNHVEIAVRRLQTRASHGSGCTHSASLAALLAQGASLEAAARAAANITASAVAHGIEGMGGGEGPVDVLDVRARRANYAGGASQRRRTR